MAKLTQPVLDIYKKNNIQIIGENVLYNNGIITAYYILPMSNYATNTVNGIVNSIADLQGIITNLVSSNPELIFSIERIDKVVQAKDVIANLLGTIRMYSPDYEMPYAFSSHVKDDTQSYCILGVDIQQSSVTDIEDDSIKDTAKSIVKAAINAFTGLGNMKIDPIQILKIENDIYRTVKYKCVRCSKDLVFYHFVSKLFPSYEISYDKLSYINDDSYEDIMCNITQVIADNHAKFEMYNDGVEVFGLDPVHTFGCMMHVEKFPEAINIANFPMDYPANCVTTVKCIPKDKAKLALKRARSSSRYVIKQEIESQAEDEDIEATQQNVELATAGIQMIEKGTIFVEFNTTFLVHGETPEEVRSYATELINVCKDRNIFVNKNLNQAKDFMNIYVSRNATKYKHFAPLTFPLSFQQNSGSIVGDNGGKRWTPAIGVDVT